VTLSLLPPLPAASVWQRFKSQLCWRGSRVAFDPIGGQNFAKLISALAQQGIVYIYGALAEGPTSIPVLGNDPQAANHQGV
jgi:NADPH:quinone reductase-like Zn-dependent oxidoreductase